MHREIQIKQFPIVTTHWWPKTRNERFVWENQQYLYRFLPLVHNHVQVIWVRTHIRCVTCVCVCVRALHSHGASASTLDGGRVWSVAVKNKNHVANILLPQQSAIIFFLAILREKQKQNCEIQITHRSEI